MWSKLCSICSLWWERLFPPLEEDIEEDIEEARMNAATQVVTWDLIRKDEEWPKELD